MNTIRTFSIAVILIASFTISHAATALAVSTSNTTDRLNNYISISLETYDIPGASAVIQKDNKILIDTSWGHSSNGSNVTANTPFLIGSLSKPITATAIVLLAQNGIIKLDEPIKTYLPQFEYSSSSSQPIKVRHLLEQTSGISAEDGLNVTDRQHTPSGALSEAVNALNNVKLQSIPGETYTYTSANYLLLGAIIESASGKSYSDYVTTELFKPLAMNTTSATLQDSQRDGLVPGYSSWFGNPLQSNGFYDHSGAPYGYLSSTAHDIMKFLQFMKNGNAILNDQSMEILRTVPKKGTYGVGWFYSPESKYFYHGGATPDYRAEIFYSPERNFSGVILTNKYHNLEDQQVADIMNGARAIADNKTPSDPPQQSHVIQWSIFSLCIVLAGWCTYTIYRLVKPRRHTKSLRDGIIGGVLIVIAIGLALAFPLIFGAPWHSIILFAPDIAVLSISLIVLLCANGALSLLCILKRIRKH
ncbi:class A beta-lactamase-related serine hydrolase [bacterium]|nr:MAG: class A beta-lactamase-related serine hydrolase [bacterium]